MQLGAVARREHWGVTRDLCRWMNERKLILFRSCLQVLGSGPGFESVAAEPSGSPGAGDLERIPRHRSQVSSQRRLQVARGHSISNGESRSMDLWPGSGTIYFSWPSIMSFRSLVLCAQTFFSPRPNCLVYASALTDSDTANWPCAPQSYPAVGSRPINKLRPMASHVTAINYGRRVIIFLRTVSNRRRTTHQITY